MNEYGPVLVNYQGVGTLELEDGPVDCSFEACQLRDGDILLVCKLPETDLARLFCPPEAKRFSGRTDDGSFVTATGLRETSYLPNSDNGEPGQYSAYIATYMDVKRESAASSSSKFALTNLTLATQELRVPHPSVSHACISRAQRYLETLRRLKTVKGVDVTAYLHVHADVVSTRELAANDICYLLSVACGTKA